MDDSDNVCPLCCEELDLSDREFYPCKCGYQVCMWCWHRIRETESGLCPACRTPYGDDPHQFTAVDVEDVLKANKEKEAAAKRDRQQRNSHIQITNNNNNNNAGGGGGGGGTTGTQPGGDGTSQYPNPTDDLHGEIAMDVPKDRTLLANMRVIRRNLVYAVGLPPGVATEDTLRKAEYFGQYGKIAKIVLNRSQATAADPRRASASAYVTFAHKEDTLACILALDGFHMDGRNIRASYGTSKYCSAFIKNVRCNNPDCTYLHEMGAAEDTFTKQEIQAGYVTSGRDVLARQQQIVAEQLRLAGSNGSVPRKRTGSGGPSGTGKASVHPVFPTPEFDEPSKPGTTLVPPPVGVSRTSSTGVPIPSGVPLLTRSRTASIGNKSPGRDPTPAGAATALAALSAANTTVAPQQRRVPVVSAASVVAGVHTISAPTPPEPHTTLTPLTPLKRASSKSMRPSSSSNVENGVEKLTPNRGAVTTTKKKNGLVALVTQPTPPVMSTAGGIQPTTALTPSTLPGIKMGSASIGGDPIGPPIPVRSAVASLGGDPVGPELIMTSSSASSFLGGDVYTGQLQPKVRSAIGSGKDKWNSSAEDVTIVPPAPVHNAPPLWDTTPHNGPSSFGPPLSGSGVIGGSRAHGPGTIGNSTSTLASILGISLPTGSGSLQESPNLWTATPGPVRNIPISPSPLSSLNSCSMPVHGNLIGGGAPVGLGGGSSVIGGVPIGSGSFDNGAPGTIGGRGHTNTKSDIALLQSLLPGVHITSGNESVAGFGTIGGWSTSRRSGPSSLNGDVISVMGHSNNWGGSVVSDQGSAAVAHAGTIGGSAIHQQNQRGPGIW